MAGHSTIRAHAVVVLLVLGVSANPCWPAPSIMSVAGSMEHGQTATISGSGFGSKSTAAPIKWDDFEDGVAGTSLESVDPSWVADQGAIYNNAEAHSGSLAAYNDPFTMGSWATNYFQYDPTDEVFVAYWVNITNAESTDYAIIKLTRITSSTAAGGGGTYNGTGDTGYSNINPRYGSSGYAHYNDGNDAVNLGYMGIAYDTWLRVDMYKKVSTAGVADGDVEVVTVGIDSEIHNDIMTRASGETFLQDTVRLGLMAANNEGHFEIHIDDVYIDNTRARAEIGDASTWSNCDHKEVQIPSSWSSSSISIDVNTGSFSNGTAAYLYVVDADGNVNSSGFPITIGGPVTYNLSVTNGSGDGVYQEATVVPISADPPASGKAFAVWVGDIAHVADRLQSNTTVTIPTSNVSVTATYAWVYRLTVNSGSGDGEYLHGTLVEIQADSAQTNMEFDQWAGDVAYVADVCQPTTTVTMPSLGVEVTATYACSIPGDLDGDGFVGQGDLDMLLDNWGDNPPADPRADPSGDGMVGQDDLDIVLDNWGKGAQP